MLISVLRSVFFALAVAVYTTVSAQTSADRPRIAGTVHTVLEADGRLKFVFVPDVPVQMLKPGDRPSQLVEAPWMQGIFDPSTFAGDKANTFKVTSDKGKFAGYWVGADTPESAMALQSTAMQGWSLEKVATFNPTSLANTASAFPIPEAQVMNSLRVELLARAKDLACKSAIRPKEVAVTASLQASIGLIVGGAGTVSFQATWETVKLCVR
jgi:hypothetical protein